jgi:succinate-semialdehyde dehydrogenase/glutarate-semialdehyde dehydrogenase
VTVLEESEMASIRSVNPATGAVLATFEEDSEESVERAIAAAASAVRPLSAAGFGQRAAWLRAAADLLDDESELVAMMITSEMGKPIAQSRAEVAKSSYCMRFYAEHAADFLRGRSLDQPEAVNASAARTRFDPLGVVLAVMPWNYPIWQVVRFAAPALMAGNAGLLKHASNVPRAARYLGGLFERAGFPHGAFSSLLVGAGRVPALIADRRIAAITLTGSEGAGRAVARAAGDVLKKVVLELGGSDPFIVMPSANLDDAVSAAVRARTLNNGQACINAKRFIVHADVYEAFEREFVRQMSQLRVGDPSDELVQLGPLATIGGLCEIEELVEDARAKGASILTGGARARDESGYYYRPTVVADLGRDMRLWNEEAFGPVASLYRVASVDEAIDLANESDFGLGSAFWSNDPKEIERAEGGIAAGAVFINGVTTSYPELPFGGIKRSGFGRELSMEGIREFCNLKSVWIG